MFRVVVRGLGVLSGAMLPLPANAADGDAAEATAEADAARVAAEPAKEPKSGIDIVHLHAAIGVSAMAFGTRYELRAAQPDGGFGATRIQARRYGFGPTALLRAGFAVDPRLSFGAEVERSEVHAPLREESSRIAGRYADPWVTYWHVGMFLEHGLTPTRVGGSVGYARLTTSFDERVITPSEAELEHYSLAAWIAQAWPVGNETSVTWSFRVSVMGFLPLGFLAWWAQKPNVIPQFIDEAHAGVTAGVRFR